MAKRTACILTALCVTAAAVPGTGGYNYNEVFAAEEADDLREGLSVYLNFDDALTTNSASQSAQKVEVQGSGVTRKRVKVFQEVRHILMEHLHLAETARCSQCSSG